MDVDKMGIICVIFGHDYYPSHYGDWQKDGTNFICRRCRKRAKKFEDTLKS